jgi:hypothetical protein
MTVNKHLPYNAPAQMFEARYGVSGISREYRMPAGRSMMEMEALLWDEVFEDSVDPMAQRMERGRHYVAAFKALNPELRNITVDPDDYVAVRDFLHGVTSGFNPDDIEFRLHAPDADQCCEQISRITNILVRQEFYDANVAWFPSPQTAALIVEQLETRCAFPPPPGKIIPNQKLTP